MNQLDALLDQLADRVAERVIARLGAPAPASDRTLTVEETAALLSATQRWVRTHRVELGGQGTRKVLRFSEARIRAWCNGK
jgi:hypothetical protein